PPSQGRVRTRTSDAPGGALRSDAPAGASGGHRGASAADSCSRNRFVLLEPASLYCERSRSSADLDSTSMVPRGWIRTTDTRFYRSCRCVRKRPVASAHDGKWTSAFHIYTEASCRYRVRGPIERRDEYVNTLRVQLAARYAA